MFSILCTRQLSVIMVWNGTSFYLGSEQRINWCCSKELPLAMEIWKYNFPVHIFSKTSCKLNIHNLLKFERIYFFWRLFNLSAGKKYVIPESELNCYYSDRSRATSRDYARLLVEQMLVSWNILFSPHLVMTKLWYQSNIWSRLD